MNDNNKIRLLAGLPIKLYNVDLYPLTLRDVAIMGYEEYYTKIYYLTAEPKDFNLSKDIDIDSITIFDIILSNMYYSDEKHREDIINMLETVFRQKVMFAYCKSCFYIGDIKNNNIINKDNYIELKKALKLQNGIKDKKEEFKCANSKAEEIRQKILKGRQKLNKNIEPTFEDLVSALASKGNGLNILNIWDLTVYQFYNQLIRTQMIEDYNINIKSLLAGAKKEDVNLKYYIRPIED
jgi:hypothetical protein